MEQAQFERIKNFVSVATAGQILELEAVIQRVIAQQFIEVALALRSQQALQARTCPHCQSNKIVLHGKDQNRRQRFMCRGCRKTYNIMTGTPMARARRPDTWGKYLGCMTEHMSVRKIVASGIDVHQVTAWRWRHRFLQAAANDNAAILSGIIQVDRIFVPTSFKESWKTTQRPANRAARARSLDGTKPGSSHEYLPVLTAVDNSGSVYQAILVGPGDIEVALAARIEAGSVLCSNGTAAYVNAAEQAKAEHYAVLAPPTTPHAVETHPLTTAAQKPGRLGLGRVSHYNQRLKHLIDEQCRGVATKYLGNYLGWQRAMMRSGFQGKTLLSRALGNL